MTLNPTDNAAYRRPEGRRMPHRHLAPEVAESLRRARRRHGWSFRAAARATGVDAVATASN
jgi:hypothetical protein